MEKNLNYSFSSFTTVKPIVTLGESLEWYNGWGKTSACCMIQKFHFQELILSIKNELGKVAQAWNPN
jgi:hypothetical protein